MKRNSGIRTLHCVVGAWALVLFGAISSASSAATLPLRVAADQRSLVTSNGVPFFWLGDTNWRLYKLARPEVRTYLRDRRNQYFNVIQGPVLLHPTSTVETRTFDGHTNTNPSIPNIAFFRHIDFIINTADEMGLYVAPVVVWGHDWNLFSSTTAAHNFGRWLGNRYRNHTNVIWIVAGEYLIEGFDLHIMNIWDAIGRGLKVGSQGRHLVTIHGSFEVNRQSSSVMFHDATWLDFNMIQSSQSGNALSGANNWALIYHDHRLTPTKPTLDGEAHYEGLGGWNAFGVRRRAYWCVLAGGFGHTYGANAVWQSYRGTDDVSETAATHPWHEALHYPGSRHMKHLRRLAESRPTLNRIPAPGVMSEPAGGVPRHVQVARGRGGHFIMAYIPQVNRTITINLDRLAGTTAHAWWFNPRNGQATLIGTFPSSGNRSFTTPGTGPDWVLVLDNAAQNFPPPGQGGPLR